jgi:anti-sigma B factor antagonist
MDISIRKKGKYLIVALTGELNLYNATELKSQIKSAESSETSNLAMDFTDLIYIDSMGLGLLAHLNKEYGGKESGRFRVMGVRPEVMNVFRITAMETLFSFVDSEDGLQN